MSRVAVPRRSTPSNSPSIAKPRAIHARPLPGSYTLDSVCGKSLGQHQAGFSQAGMEPLRACVRSCSGTSAIRRSPGWFTATVLHIAGDCSVTGLSFGPSGVDPRARSLSAETGALLIILTLVHSGRVRAGRHGVFSMN